MLQLGERLGAYVVEGEIGRGGLGCVYRARHVCLGAVRALKLGWVRGAMNQRRLRLEGQLQSRLEHRNVLSILEMFEHKGHPVLVLEYIEGPTLESYLEQGLMPLPFVEMLVEGMLDGLSAAHRENIIHRDLKPSNVLLAPENPDSDRPFVPKIADFGIARLLGTSQGLTAAGRMLGSPSYMAPEQWSDPRKVDARADLFSFGCVLYEMLAGTQAFPGNDLRKIEQQIAAGGFVPLRLLRPELPERMFAAVERCLAVRREDRPASCDALRSLWQGETSSTERTQIIYQDTLIPSEEARTVVRKEPPALALGEETKVLPPARPPSQTVSTKARRWRASVAATVVLLLSVPVFALVQAQEPTMKRPIPVHREDSVESIERSLVEEPDTGESTPVSGDPVTERATLNERAAPPDREVMTEPVPIVPERATLTITQSSSMGWADVLLDGEPLSKRAPFRGLDIPYGVHILQIEHSQLGRFQCDSAPSGSLSLKLTPSGATAQGGDVRCVKIAAEPL